MALTWDPKTSKVQSPATGKGLLTGRMPTPLELHKRLREKGRKIGQEPSPRALERYCVGCRGQLIFPLIPRHYLQLDRHRCLVDYQRGESIMRTETVQCPCPCRKGPR